MIEPSYTQNVTLTTNLAEERDGLLQELKDVVAHIKDLNEKNGATPVVWSSSIKYNEKNYHTV